MSKNRACRLKFLPPLLMRSAAMLVLGALLPVLAYGQDLPATYPPPIDRGRYYLAFTPIDSTDLPEPPSPPDAISAIDFSFLVPPSEQRANEIWRVELAGDLTGVGDGDTVYVDPKAHSSTPNVSFSFLDYYPGHELLLFRSRQHEYSRHIVVSRGEGEVAVAFGAPVFSPDGKWFITVSGYSISGWSPQGIQLFAVGEGWFTEVVRFRTSKIKFPTGRRARNQFMGAPTRCEWVDENTFLMEMRRGIDSIESAPSYKHYRVDIRETDE
jgi:hypothetical protein